MHTGRNNRAAGSGQLDEHFQQRPELYEQHLQLGKYHSGGISRDSNIS